jgi:hypothetical protein
LSFKGSKGFQEVPVLKRRRAKDSLIRWNIIHNATLGVNLDIITKGEVAYYANLTADHTVVSYSR